MRYQATCKSLQFIAITSETFLKALVDEGPVAGAHQYMSTGCQNPFGNHEEVRRLRALWWPRVGGDLHAQLEIVIRQVEPHPNRQHKQLLLAHRWTWDIIHSKTFILGGEEKEMSINN